MIILYFKGPSDFLKQMLSSSNFPFKNFGNVFILSAEVEEFLIFVENLPQEALQKLRLYVYNEKRPIKVEDLIDIGFNSMSLDELLEEHMFKNLFKVLGSIKVHFHPIIDVSTKKIHGFEALSRLSVPIYKLFKLSDRIALLADSHCRDRALLEFSRYHTWSPYCLFLNFHPKFLNNPLENLGEIINSIRSRNIDPSRIVVEINEYEGMDLKSLKLIRAFLKKEGVKVALDDVGAGYSGLYQLTEIHPDIAKIDMVLIRDVHTHPVKQSLLKGLVPACKSVGIKVLAEGVEKKEELEFVLDLGVDLIQGYIFAKPDPYPKIKDIEKLAHELLSQIIASHYIS